MAALHMPGDVHQEPSSGLSLFNINLLAQTLHANSTYMGFLIPQGAVCLIRNRMTLLSALQIY